jgi:hypothetical protein
LTGNSRRTASQVLTCGWPAEDWRQMAGQLLLWSLHHAAAPLVSPCLSCPERERRAYSSSTWKQSRD